MVMSMVDPSLTCKVPCSLSFSSTWSLTDLTERFLPSMPIMEPPTETTPLLLILPVFIDRTATPSSVQTTPVNVCVFW